MNNLLTFDFEESAVRVVTIDGVPWWVLNDVCDILDISNSRDAAKRLYDWQKGCVGIADAMGRERETNIINESGIYKLILNSRKPEAERFEYWLTAEVLPALRRTGRYDLAPAGSGPEEVDAAVLNARVATVREARRLFGHGVARAVWRDLGLPLPDEAMLPVEDGLAAAIALAVDGRDRFTNDDLAGWLGLGRPDTKMRQRFGDILRGMGWESRKTRFGPSETAYAWHAPQMAEA